MKCPVCLQALGDGALSALSGHLVDRAGASDPGHVRWLNQNATRQRTTADLLVPALRRVFDRDGGSLGRWIKRNFIAKFYGARVHPFVEALQRPSRQVLLGYVFEHRHFLRQWVRSCSIIMARSDQDDAIRYELDNLNSEFGGWGHPERSHYQLLLNMGESLGVSPSEILAASPLSTTRRCIEEWEAMAQRGSWVETMAAMHSLELIASRDLRKEGATMHYFDPGILDGSDVTEATKAFLREGYEADVGHSDEALALVEKYATSSEEQENVQASCLRSFDLFDDYLIARLERATSFDR